MQRKCIQNFKQQFNETTFQYCSLIPQQFFQSDISRHSLFLFPANDDEQKKKKRNVTVPVKVNEHLPADPGSEASRSRSKNVENSGTKHSVKISSGPRFLRRSFPRGIWGCLGTERILMPSAFSRSFWLRVASISTRLSSPGRGNRAAHSCYLLTQNIRRSLPYSPVGERPRRRLESTFFSN